MAEDKKGITVKIDADLHAQVRKYMESHSMTMADFIAAACNDLLHPKIKEEKNIRLPQKWRRMKKESAKSSLTIKI